MLVTRHVPVVTVAVMLGTDSRLLDEFQVRFLSPGESLIPRDELRRDISSRLA